MKKIIIFLLLLPPVLTSFAQVNCNVKQAHAFYTVSMPGMAMVDENGNTIPPVPTITRYIYFEWSGVKEPSIETVLYDKTAQSVEYSSFDSTSVIPVIDYGNNSDHKITAKKCNRIWVIQIYPKPGSLKVEQDCRDIVVKFKGAGNSCDIRIAKETHLMTLPRY